MTLTSKLKVGCQTKLLTFLTNVLSDIRSHIINSEIELICILPQERIELGNTHSQISHDRERGQWKQEIDKVKFEKAELEKNNSNDDGVGGDLERDCERHEIITNGEPNEEVILAAQKEQAHQANDGVSRETVE